MINSFKIDFTAVFNCRKLIKDGKSVHDDYYMSLNLNKPFKEKTKRTSEVPYKRTPKTHEQEDIRFAKQIQLENNYSNFLETFYKTRQLGGTDMTPRFTMYLRRKTQKLCKGTVSF